MNVQLKECPFCGGAAVYSDDEFIIYCKLCFVTIDGKEIVADNEKMLFSAWNKRTGTDIQFQEEGE